MKRSLLYSLYVVVVVFGRTAAFRPSTVSSAIFRSRTTDVPRRCASVRKAAKKSMLLLDLEDRIYDPTGLTNADTPSRPTGNSRGAVDWRHDTPSPSAAVATTSLVAGLATWASFAKSSTAVAALNDNISKGSLDPASFTPLCPASDGFYRVLQQSTQAVVGPDNFVEYGPLIAGGLLRVRLELCVVESFVKEAVGPFIRDNGLSWILPLHETVETFIAGVIFALASSFILLGSTKIVSVIVIYTDLLLGAPFRLFGGFAYDRAMGKPVTLDVGFGPLKTRVIGPPEPKDGESDPNALDWSKINIFSLVVILISGAAKICGEILGVFREILDAIDFFVGRYLVLLATFYIGIKFLHFKVFPDFP